MTAECKFCHTEDVKENMHQDQFSKEYYHEACRPPQASAPTPEAIKRRKTKKWR